MTFDYPIAFNAVKLMTVMARIGAFTIAIPIFNSDIISGTYRYFFVMIISIILLPLVPSGWLGAEMFENMDLFKLSFLLISEALLGLSIALVVLILVEAFQLSGYVMDRDIGFTMAEVVDPATNIDGTLLSGVFVKVFYIMFIIQDGHYEIIRIAAASFQTLQPGQFLVTSSLVETVIMMSSQVFVVAMQICMPIVATMLLINIALGLLARLGEDFEVLMISFPIRFGLGFIILMWTFPIVLSFCRKINEELFGWVSYLAQL